MSRIWVTCGTPTIPGILNPLTAACHQGYVPHEACILSNPAVEKSVVEATDSFKDIIDTYGGDAKIHRHDLDYETDFEAILEFYRSAIEGARAGGDTIAIDVTPGRKFMSAIAFQAGIQFDADHVFYFHRKSGAYYGQFYPEIPRTATDLIDFTEVV